MKSEARNKSELENLNVPNCLERFNSVVRICFGSRYSTFAFLAFVAALSLPTPNAAAAELRLRVQCVPAAAVVTLGDVTDIGSTDARQAAALAAIELFPAPVSGEERTVGLREVQDLLLLRGVNLAEHQFSGASEIVVSAAAAKPRAATPRPISTPELQRIKRRIGDALTKYLNEHSANPQDRSIEFELSEANARLFANAVAPLEVTGGAAPWTGSQRFDIAVAAKQGSEKVTIEAAVRVIAPVVVTTRSLPRGTIVRDGDVALQRAPAADKLPGVQHSLEEAIGHELVRAVGAGSPVTTDTLRPPLAVHRGEVVTVVARSGGVRIRTNARARDEGSVGELVAVESLANRSTYYARVSNMREVEVFARPPQIESER
jgi:flagella basal body P-ring formation protein FlgA